MVNVAIQRRWLCVACVLPLVCASCPAQRQPLSSRQVRLDGAVSVPIHAAGSLQNPAFSPDGRQLLITRFRGGYNVEPADLLIVDLTDGATRTLVADGSGNVNLPGAAWNADTHEIVFSSSREPHDEIFTINENGQTGDEVRITDRTSLMAFEPSLSPDGEWVVFESHPLDIETNGVVTKYKLDGSHPYTPLTAANDDCRQPNWSPAGDRIVYQRRAGGRWDLWLTDASGNTHTQLTTGPGDKTDASFSPSGQWIVYSSDHGELAFANLFVIPVSGGDPIRLTHYRGYDGAPSWSSAGQIAFESSRDDPDGGSGTTLWTIAPPAQTR